MGAYYNTVKCPKSYILKHCEKNSGCVNLINRLKVNTMADWHTPTQVERALTTMWMKLEKSNVPLKDISEEDPISYFGNKKPVVQKLQYELLFNSNKPFDPKSKQDSWRSKKEMHDNIYEEEDQRTMPLVTSHFIGHRLKNLEGRSLNNYMCKEENNK